MRPIAMKAITMPGADALPDAAFCRQRLSGLLDGRRMSVSSLHTLSGDARLMMNWFDQRAGCVVHSLAIYVHLDVMLYTPPQ